MNWKHALAALVVGGTACVLLSRPGTGAQAPELEEAPALYYWWRPLGESVEAGELMEHLRAFQEYVRDQPDVRFSVYEHHFLESGQQVHSFVEAKDSATLDRFWTGAMRDPEIKSVLGEWQRLTPGKGDHLLRQIAGEHAEGVAWASKHVVQRSARIRFGKLGAALEAARAITDHVNRTGGGLTVRAYVEIVGDVETIRWFTTLPTVAPGPFARLDARLAADPKYLELLDEAADSFVEDSLEDLWLSPVI